MEIWFIQLSDDACISICCAPGSHYRCWVDVNDGGMTCSAAVLSRTMLWWWCTPRYSALTWSRRDSRLHQTPSWNTSTCAADKHENTVRERRDYSTNTAMQKRTDLGQRNLVFGADAVLRGGKLGVDDQLAQVSAPHQHLRLVIGQTHAVQSDEGQCVGESSSVRQQLPDKQQKHTNEPSECYKYMLKHFTNILI